MCFYYQGGIRAFPMVDFVNLAWTGFEEKGDGLGWEGLVLAHDWKILVDD
jgi:hypothetical protein